MVSRNICVTRIGSEAEVWKDYGIEANREAALAFGNRVRSTPGVPPLSVEGAARLRWWAAQLQFIAQALKEEAAEYNREGQVNEGLLTIRLQLSVEETGEWAEALASGDIQATFNELVDMSVVTDGHYHTLGLADLKVEGYREVHAANMSKLGDDGKPIISEAGRWMKGPHTRKPDLGRVLREAEERNEPLRQG
jgi:NTP pyrophosphatase (non-canonical NTP hydrolase)